MTAEPAVDIIRLSFEAWFVPSGYRGIGPHGVRIVLVKKLAGRLGFKKRKMMKDTCNLVYKMVLGLVFCSMLFWFSGCAQPGETVSEVRRRHLRNKRINAQELAADADMAMLYDKPSTLTDKRVP